MKIFVLMLAFVLTSSLAAGKEAWVVVAYLDHNGHNQDNRLFYDSSAEGPHKAESTAAAACELFAQSRKAEKSSYECRTVGLCSGPGWFAIASTIKTTGAAAVSCNQPSEADAVAMSKKACGSPACAKHFTHEIK